MAPVLCGFEPCSIDFPTIVNELQNLMIHRDLSCITAATLAVSLNEDPHIMCVATIHVIS